MSIDTSASGLLHEIRTFESKMAPVHEYWRSVVSSYTTPAYSGHGSSPEPENYRFTHTLHTMARVMSGSPRVRLKAHKQPAEARVEEFEIAGNAWTMDTHYDELREQMLVDHCLQDICAVMVTQRARPGFEQFDDPIMTPAAVRIPGWMFGWDMYAETFRSARILWHLNITPRDELIAHAIKNTDEGWDVEAIRLVSEDPNARKEQDRLPRDEIAYYSVWCPKDDSGEIPEGEDESKYHGTVFTVARGQTERAIRKPYRYFGPSDGPYSIGGMMIVPNTARFMSLLTAASGLIEQANAQARANDRSAAKKVDATIIDCPTEDGNAALLSIKDGDVRVVPGVSRSGVVPIYNITGGGIRPESNEREDRLDNKVKLILGLGDAIQGQATGDATLGENIIAAQATNNITRMIDRRFGGHESDVLRKVLWFFDQDERSGVYYDGDVYLGGNTYDEKMSSLQRAAEQGLLEPDEAKQQMQTLEDVEGPKGQLSDLAVTIESVRRTEAEVQNLTVANNLLLQYAPILPQIAGYTPGLGKFFTRVGEALAMPELGEVFDFDAAAEMGQAMMEAAQTPETAPAPPRTVPGPQRPQATPKPQGTPKAAAKVASQ